MRKFYLKIKSVKYILNFFHNYEILNYYNQNTLSFFDISKRKILADIINKNKKDNNNSFSN